MFSGRYSNYSTSVGSPYYRASKGYTGINRQSSSYASRLPKRYVYRRRGFQRGVERVINKLAEQKYFDTTQVNFLTQNYYSGGPLCCTLIPQNTTDTSRIGDKLMLNSIQYSFITTPVSTLGACIKHYIFRLVIFKWYDDTIPGWSSILQSIGLPYENMTQGPFEHDRKVKRKILVNRTFVATQGQSSGSVASTSNGFPCLMQGYVDLKKKSKRLREIHYEAGSTTGVGHLYYGILSAEQDQDALVPYTFGVGYTSSYLRVTFIDM